MSLHQTKRLLFTTSALVLALTANLHAQTVMDSGYNSAEDQLRQPSKPTSVVPLTTRFILNGETLDHTSKGSLTLGVTGGTKSSNNPILTGTIGFSKKLTEGINNGIFERHQSGWYLQHKRIDRKREVTVTQRQAVDMVGFKLQFSATGDCRFPGTTPDQLCTYTPGLATVPGKYDPAYFLPTKFAETSQTGDVIDQATYDAMLAPGWQRGVAGSSTLLGVDFDIPNSGTIASKERAQSNGISRREHISQRSVLSLSKIDQKLYSNDTQASIARTTRGLVLLKNHEWTTEAILMQAAGWFLPKMDAKLNAGSGDPNLNIGNNLFYAANNQWSPRDSFTVFQTGRGYVDHAKRPPRDITETPVSYFNGFWMGYSPVRSTEVKTSSWLRTTGDRETTHGPYFTQGGLTDANIDFPNSTITILDDISEQITQIELSNINNLFVQSGMELTTQNALAYASTRETSHYSLIPHIAFAGNRTDGTSVLRYYTGALIDDGMNGYVGADYSLATTNGVLLTARAEAYSRPDRDYYSFAEARVIKSTGLKNGHKLSYGIGARKAFDRPGAAIDRFDALSNDSVVDLLGGYKVNNGLSFDVRQRFSDEGNGKSTSTSTTFGTSYRVSDRLALNAQITPISTEDAYIRARAGVSWRLGNTDNAGTLQLQVADIKYDYGVDSVGQKLRTSERTFLAAYQLEF